MTTEKTQKHQTLTGKGLPLYPSMAACSGATGIPLGVLKEAKRGGCPAFTNANRVDLNRLLPWLFRESAGEDQTASDWGKELKKWQAKRAKLEHDEKVGILVERSAVLDKVREVNAKARAVLTRFLEVELPAQCAGLGAAEIARRNKAALEEICGILGKAEPE